MVIVTNRCYLVCEKVTSITVQEYESESTKKRPRLKAKGKVKKAVVPLVDKTSFKLEINYIPASANVAQKSSSYHATSGNTTEHTIELDVFTKVATFALYHELVKQIRDQTQDQIYLDKMVDELLGKESGEQAVAKML